MVITLISVQYYLDLLQICTNIVTYNELTMKEIIVRLLCLEIIIQILQYTVFTTQIR